MSQIIVSSKIVSKKEHKLLNERKVFILCHLIFPYFCLRNLLAEVVWLICSSGWELSSDKAHDIGKKRNVFPFQTWKSRSTHLSQLSTVSLAWNLEIMKILIYTRNYFLFFLLLQKSTSKKVWHQTFQMLIKLTIWIIIL